MWSISIPCARPSRIVDTRARRRARRERAPRSARALPSERGREGLGQAAHDERRNANRCCDARPWVLFGHHQGGADPRAHGRSAGASGGGARASDRLLYGCEGRGGGRVRARVGGWQTLTLVSEIETLPWSKQLLKDDAAYCRQLTYLFERSS